MAEKASPRPAPTTIGTQRRSYIRASPFVDRILLFITTTNGIAHMDTCTSEFSSLRGDAAHAMPPPGLSDPGGGRIARAPCAADARASLCGLAVLRYRRSPASAATRLGGAEVMTGSGTGAAAPCSNSRATLARLGSGSSAVAISVTTPHAAM
jgi:hypothetical protein